MLLILGSLMLALLVYGPVASQEVISASGGSGEGVTVDVGWSLGEPVSATGEMKSFDLLQGFHQPFPVFAIESMDLDFGTGWNLFSSWVRPVDSELKQVFTPLILEGALIRVQDDAGHTLEDLGNLGGWTNAIGDLAYTEGYKVRVSRGSQLEIRGGRASLPLDIPLVAGWNILGFPIDVPVDAILLVKPLLERRTLVKMQDEQGNSLEDRGVFGGWVNHIGDCLPGKAYRINVTTAEVLTIYPAYVTPAP